MNTTETALADLLTGDAGMDAKLREAFALGIRHGQAADRKSIQRSAEIDVTRRLLTTLMRVQHLDLEAALVTLQIPRAERKTYAKIFAHRESQRQARKK